MRTQEEKGRAFRALHQREGAFVIPNPWDAGSAHLLARMGFEALATTSAGFAYSIGKADGAVGRAAMMAHVASIASAVDVPVSGDLENGYGDAPEETALTIRLAAEAGLVGCSIEDATGREDDPIYDLNFAVARVAAAVDAARALPFDFTLTARCENFLHGRSDLSDTIRRLQAYEKAGADVVYAPGLTRLEEIASVVRAVQCPVNVLATPGFEVARLAELGVKRISVGSALARAAYTAMLDAGREMQDKGTFGFAGRAMSYGEMNAMFEPRA